jgi:hypothetical protein
MVGFYPAKSGAEATAVQTLRDQAGVKPREASGLRRFTAALYCQPE